MLRSHPATSRPHPILPAVEGRDVREVLTQAHILPGRAGERQGQDHCQQPEPCGLHGDGRAVGAGHSVDVRPLPRRLIYTPVFAQVFWSLFVWGQALPLALAPPALPWA